jgi:hypothetical protein
MHAAAVHGNSILFSEMTPDSSWESDFNDWYDTEHIPLRMAVKGFLSAQRYLAPGTRDYLVVYEMKSAAVLKTGEYQSIKNNPSDRTRRMLQSVGGFTRYIADASREVRRSSTSGPESFDAPCLYSVFFNVPSERESEFDSWYNEDHIPALMECRDWLMVRRFRIIDGEPARWTHLALHYLADARALDSPERARARESPWRARLAQETWFKPRYIVSVRHGVRQLGKG